WGSPGQGSVRAGLVVVPAEGVELELEVGKGLGRRLLPEELLERLVEALHLAAGLGVAVAGVLVLDAQARQLGLQVDLAAAGAGVEDQAVVAEPGSGVTVFATGSVEDFDDVPG